MRHAILTGLVLLASACAPVVPTADEPVSAPPGPTLAPSTGDPAAEAAAADLLASARTALDLGRLEDAEASLTRVVDGYPGTRVSVEALWARAQLLGADSVRADETADDVRRLLGVLPGTDPRVVPARLLLGEALVARGDLVGGLRSALSLPGVERPARRNDGDLPAEGAPRPGTEPEEPPRVEPADTVPTQAAAPPPLPGDTTGDPAPPLTIAPPPAVRVPGWVAESAAELDAPGWDQVLPYATPEQPLAGTVLLAYARNRRMAGVEADARAFALRALSLGVAPDDVETGRALVQGRPLPRMAGVGPIPVGVVLPLSGSPAFQVFAQELEEGIRTAVEGWGLADDVELLVLDDGGDPSTAASLVRSAEARGAVAVVGLLEDQALAGAAAVRGGPMPLVSPTAYRTPAETGAVLSLNAFDPGAADALAEWAAVSGIQTVAIIHSVAGFSVDEADRFTETYQAMGGTVLDRFPYQPGTTFFGAQVQGAADLAPEALILPIPPEDVPALAPQLTFFGVDTLGVRILGTGGWTDTQVVQEVDTRHTDGVVVASPLRPDTLSPGYARFARAYEEAYRRTLVDGTAAAMGYDAASLVLQALRNGAGSAGDVAQALAGIQALEGATGELSVVEGRVQRRHHVVCLQGGEAYPIQAGELPEQLFRPYPPDEETGEVPEGPGRPDGFACPGFAPEPAN